MISLYKGIGRARQEVYHGQVKAISRSSDCQEFWRELHLFD